jgi:hypothetical protein
VGFLDKHQCSMSNHLTTAAFSFLNGGHCCYILCNKILLASLQQSSHPIIPSQLATL